MVQNQIPSFSYKLKAKLLNKLKRNLLNYIAGKLLNILQIIEFQILET